MAERFLPLRSVQQTKPELPEEDPTMDNYALDMDGLDCRQQSPGDVVDGLPPRSGCRSGFKMLVEQLVVQHTREVAALQIQLNAALALNERSRAEKLSERSAPPPEPSGEEAETSAAVATNSVASEHASDGLPRVSPTSARFTKSSSKGHSGVKRKRAEVREVNASDVIDMLDQKGEPLYVSESDKSDFLSEIAPDEDHVPRQYSTRFELLQAQLQSPSFEGIITCMLLVNVLWMGLEFQVSGSRIAHQIGIDPEPLMSDATYQTMDVLFTVGDIVFTAIFGIDVLFRMVVLRCEFWKNYMNYIDVAVTLTSLTEVFLYSGVPVNPMLFRLLRIGKLARTFRMMTMSNVLTSLQLLIKCLTASVDMLFWTFGLLAFLQCLASMVIGTLCRDFVANEERPLEVRQEVFRYYGTFTRTFLTMFEVLFANWAPPARVLVENMSEWFSVFFLFYRCVLGFAVLNVVSAVFVQQTMKTASSDEELAFKQKERDVHTYTRKVKKVFATMDQSGDGALNMEEFAKLVKSPKLKFWMGQLELEYHDLMSLFEFLDNGDGQITLTEFIEGAARLRGSAKALDVWRLETKVEVLFEEVVSMLRKVHNGWLDSEGSESGSAVQGVFENSKYKHIQTATRA